MNIVHYEKQNLSSLCALLGYSRQAYYKNTKRVEREYFKIELLIQQILVIRYEQPKIGCRKLHYMLAVFMFEHDISIGRDALFDLMRSFNLLVRRRRRKPLTTFSQHWLKKYPNLIKGLYPERPCQIWVSDITYIKIVNKHAYLSIITDVYSRMIVGYYLSEDLTAQGSHAALRMALRNKLRNSELIHHSDRGVQYCSYDYTKELYLAGIKISMAETGDPLENAIAERVNGILKAELLQKSYPNFELAALDVKKAIIIYNTKRPHSSIDMLTPAVAHISSGRLERRWKNYYKHFDRKEANMA
jgi:putative transposase